MRTLADVVFEIALEEAEKPKTLADVAFDIALEAADAKQS